MKRFLISAVLVAGIVLTGTGYAEKFLAYCGFDRLTHASEAYLESSIEQSLRTFGLLSTLKVGLAIVEGSEIGVGFGLEVGDVVQSAYDYVDIAWRTVLAAGVILLGTRYILQTAALVDQWFLLLTLMGVWLMCLTLWFAPGFKRLNYAFRDISLFLTILTVSFYIILPLSVSGGAVLSHRVTAPSIKEAEKGLSAVRDDLFANESDDRRGFGLKWGHTKEQFNKIYSYFREKTSDLIVWILKLIAGYLFDCVVFPLLLFAALLGLTKATVKYFFSTQER